MMIMMRKLSVHQKFAAAVTAMVLIVIGAGLWLAGSPSQERARRFDQTRVSDLQQISAAVDAHYERNGALPGSLEALQSASKGEWYVSSYQDPETREPYRYEIGGVSDYRLCATFNMQSEEDPNMAAPPRAVWPSYPGGPNPVDWSHPDGEHCYELDAENRVGAELCGLTNPCASGQTCASLPNRSGTVCVPQGLECQAAGCAPEACVILESYPVQVRCTPEGEAAFPEPDGSQCILMKNKNNGKIDCFGCSSTVCKDPAAGWEPYEMPEDYIGIPYSCYDAGGTQGCQLAQ